MFLGLEDADVYLLRPEATADDDFFAIESSTRKQASVISSPTAYDRDFMVIRWYEPPLELGRCELQLQVR